MDIDIGITGTGIVVLVPLIFIFVATLIWEAKNGYPSLQEKFNIEPMGIFILILGALFAAAGNYWFFPL